MVDRMKEFLTRFDKDYKVAFAKQQGVSDNFDTEQELDDYLNYEEDIEEDNVEMPINDISENNPDTETHPKSFPLKKEGLENGKNSEEEKPDTTPSPTLPLVREGSLK